MRKFIYGSMAMLSLMTFCPAGECNAAGNPLMEKSTLPLQTIPFDKLKPSDFEEAIKEGIKEQNQEIDAICRQRSTPDFDNTIAALDRSGKLLSRAEYALSNLEHALGDTTLMKIMANVTPMLSEHSANMLLNRPLWNRIKQVYDNRDKFNLNPEQMRLLSETYLSFAENGANLEGDAREKYRRLNTELSDLNVKFAQNVSNEMKSADKRLWVEGKDMGGIPESIKAAARAEAKETLEAEGKADNPDLYLFTMFAPSYFPFMQYADNRDLREKLYRMYTSRNMGGEFDNMQILKDISNVRLEIANLLGKKNFAEFQLTRTMAGSPENVYKLLDQLRDAYKPAMNRELEEISTYAAEKQGVGSFELKPWDYSYWFNKLKAERYAFDDEELRPYFELNNTVKGVFGLASKLYGYTFKERNDIPGYHPDVTCYEVFTPKGETLGLLYTDFFYRPGKAPGAWMTEFRPATKDDEGNREIPIISIVMNFSKPVGNEAVLLTASEVNTFLHEFGHALHGLSAQATYPSLSGTNVYHDFVEVFSQFNENYMTEKEWLDSFAKHYKTGKKMPKSLIDRFIKSQQFGAAYSCMRQLGFGVLDMAYHTIEEPLRASADIASFESKAMDSVKCFDQIEGCVISPAFAHVFSGGYAAGYYGYKWAEMIEADAFDAFKQHGVFDKKTANKFHHMMEMGGTVDPMTLYIEFRGQEPTVDALMRRDGIKK